MRSWWLARGVRQPPASSWQVRSLVIAKSAVNPPHSERSHRAYPKTGRVEVRHVQTSTNVPPANIAVCQWRALAAMAPAAAPRANHFRARAVRWRTLPPLAALRASSRDLVKVADLSFSSARSDWVTASLAWQALQSRM